MNDVPARTRQLLIDLARRCLAEPASRAMDAEIYCAIHDIDDGNDLASPSLRAARCNGEVLVPDARWPDWVETPPFSTDLRYAASLMPDGLYLISRDPRVACATALSARALAGTPPIPQVSVCRAASS